MAIFSAPIAATTSPATFAAKRIRGLARRLSSVPSTIPDAANSTADTGFIATKLAIETLEQRDAGLPADQDQQTLERHDCRGKSGECLRRGENFRIELRRHRSRNITGKKIEKIQFSAYLPPSQRERRDGFELRFRGSLLRQDSNWVGPVRPIPWRMGTILGIARANFGETRRPRAPLVVSLTPATHNLH